MRGKRLASFNYLLFGGSVLRQLTVSYIILMTVLALVIGISSHAISSRNYQKQVAELNQRLLNRYAIILNDNVIKEAQRIHQDLCLNLTLKTSLEVLFEEDYDIVKVKRLHGELLKIVSASSGRIEAIHIRSLPNDFHISSMMGYKDNSEINRRMLPNLYWSANADQQSERAIWMPARTLYYSSADRVNVVSYVATYPATQPFSKAKGIITIDLREEYVRDVLGRVSKEDARQFFIADPEGNLITHDTEEVPGTMVDLGFSAPAALLEASWTERVLVLPDGKHMTSRIQLANGWTLVQSMPLKAFSSVSRTIGFSNSVFSLCAVLLSLVMARRFAYRIYRPLAQITTRLRTVMRIGEGERPLRDEYVILDRAVIEMQEQVLRLSGLRERNLPLLREKILHGLIGGTLHSTRELSQLMHQIGLDINRMGKRVVVVLLEWSHPSCCREDGVSTQEAFVEGEVVPGEEGRRAVSEEQVRQLIERIARTIFPEDGEGSGPLLAALTTGTCLTLLLLSDDEGLVQHSDEILSDAHACLGVSPSLAIGSRVETPFDAPFSLRDAELALQYRFFHPDRLVFDIEDYPVDPSQENTVTSKWLNRYADCLKTNHLEEAKERILELIRWTGETTQPYPVRRRVLAEGVRILNDFACSLYINVEDTAFQIRNPLDQLPDVFTFRNWWIQATERLLALKQNAARHTSGDVVESLKQFIQENLSSELSLTRLSELTSLSKSYLSHLFKESTGLNLINYITDQRMSEARTLLLKGNLNIEAIARQLGYETPHYFSKKFRQYYGVTPSAYRLEKAQTLTSDFFAGPA